MSLQAQIQSDMIAALKARDQKKRGALSFIASELKKLAIDKRVDGLADAETISVLQKQLKLRKEVVETSLAANRKDLADDAEYEIGVIQAYLPKALGEPETRELALKVIADLGASSMKDMGKVMAECTSREPGVDKGVLSSIVKTSLSGK